MNSLKSANTLKSGFHTASENVVNRPNSMFQTGSGKTVNISPAGLLRAKSLLGLDEDCDLEQTECQSTTTKLLSRQNPPHFGTQDLRKLSLGNSTKFLTSPSVKSDFQGSESMRFLDRTNTASEPPTVIFQTAGGRSLPVSDDALQRARTLLGNPELDSFLDETSIADPPFSVIDERKPCSVNQKK